MIFKNFKKLELKNNRILTFYLPLIFLAYLIFKINKNYYTIRYLLRNIFFEWKLIITLTQVHNENGNVKIRKKYDNPINRWAHVSYFSWLTIFFE